jgi:hypothetical protein
MSPPSVVVLGLLFPQFLRCFEIIDGVCHGSAHSFAAYSHQIRDIFVSADGRPTYLRLLTLHVERKALDEPVNWRFVRCLIETDSAFYRMSQLDGPLLHVSCSARPKLCWSAARRAQRRRKVENWMVSVLTEAALRESSAKGGRGFRPLPTCGKKR